MPNFNPAIEVLEKERGSKVLVYITGNKPPIFGTKVAADVLPFFQEALEKLPSDTEKISLVLNTEGGILDAPWPLVNLIREYCKEFEVIIPEKALSAGTLISLGADRIVMLPYSHLSPIDPAAEIVDVEKKQQKRIEIEDIIGYIDFAKQKIGIKDQNSLAEVMKELSREINPTMLGSANRTHSLIRSLAKNLLALHKEQLSSRQIKQIINHLSEQLFSHRHLINRKEARNTVGFGDIIEFANETTKKATDTLFAAYSDYLELRKDFNPQTILGTNQSVQYDLPRAVVHSADIKYSFISAYQLTLIAGQAGAEVNLNNTNNKWDKI